MIERRTVSALAARLVAWAQNEEMVNQGYTAHGRDLLRAADLLRQGQGPERYPSSYSSAPLPVGPGEVTPPPAPSVPCRCWCGRRTGPDRDECKRHCGP